MADETLDSLQIEITSSSSDAVTALNGLVSSLKKLDKIGKAAGLIEVKKQLKGIAAIKFDNLSEQLAAVTAYIRELKSAGKKLSEIVMTAPTVRTTELSNSLDTIVSEVEETSERMRTVGEEFNLPTEGWVENVKKDCRTMLDSFSNLSSQIQDGRDKLRSMLEMKENDFGDNPAFANVSAFEMTINDNLIKANNSAELLEETLTRLSEQSDTPSKEKWYALEKAIISVKQQYQNLLRSIEQNKVEMDSLGKEAVKSTSKLKKLFDKFKNVAMYRVVRFLLNQIARAASEGLQNIAKFNEEANSIMSTYKTEFLYMKNSVGSMLLPILQSLLPTMVRIGDTLVDITNSIGMVSAAINGSKTFIKAKKYAQDYANAMEEVKKSTTGFDEINILGKQNSSSIDTSQMFEEVDISAWDIAGSVAKITTLIGSITTLALIFKGAKIKEFFVNFGKSISGVWKYLKNLSAWKKAGVTIAAVALEAIACYNAFYDVGLGAKSFMLALLELVPVLAIVGVALWGALGPWGLLLGAIVAVTTAIVGFVAGNIEARKELNNKHFFEGATAMSVSLNELSDSFSKTWGEAENLATYTEQANDTINQLAKEIKVSYDTINYYLGILDETGTLSKEEADEILSNVTSMVDNMETQMTTRMDSIFSTFKGLASLCRENFVNDLGEMKVAFLAFQKMLGNTTLSYQVTVDRLMDKAMNGGLTDEERIELQTAVDDLAALNVNYSDEAYQFDTLLEKALHNGIDFGSTESIKNFLDELGTTTNNYINSLTTAFNNSERQILEMAQQNKIMFDRGKITQEEYDFFNESFNDARNKLKNVYDEAVQGVYTDVQEIIDVIQSVALNNMNTVYEKAKEDYANSSWWHKLWNTETEDVQKALTDVRDKTVKDINSSINDFYNTINSEASSWLSSAAQAIINALFSTQIYDSWTTDSYGNIYYTPIVTTTDNGNIKEIINGEIAKNSSSHLSDWSGVHPNYANAPQWMYDYGVDLTKNEAIQLRRDFSKRNKDGKYDQKIADLNDYIKWLEDHGYATGGFPEDGLFMANHSELVGKFTNGKTAVANNMQIVDGIKQGVSEAMQENGGNGGDWTIQIVDEDGRIKGETIITAAERKNRRDGKTIISVGG